MSKYVSGTDTSVKACWYMATDKSAITNGVGKFTRFMLSTDDAGMGLSWDTEDVNYACEEAAITVLNTVKWEKTGIVEKIVSTENTRGYAVSNFLNSLFTNAMNGSTINEDYQTWILYSDNGGAQGTAYARPCTVQLTSKTATAGEKRGFEFDILPAGDVVQVSVGAETVDETTNEITVTTTAPGVGG